MRYSLIDITTDQMGHVIDGSQTEPQIVTELWSFVGPMVAAIGCFPRYSRQAADLSATQVALTKLVIYTCSLWVGDGDVFTKLDAQKTTTPVQKNTTSSPRMSAWLIITKSTQWRKGTATKRPCLPSSPKNAVAAVTTSLETDVETYFQS